MTPRISVVGAGSWGTAIASLLASKGFSVTLWAHSEKTFEALSQKRENSIYLPGIALSPKIKPVKSLKEVVPQSTDLILAVPSHTLRDIASEIGPLLPDEVRIISLSKGIETGTLKFPSQILDEVLAERFSGRTAFLSGPTFAREVAERKPAAATVTSKCSETATHFQNLFNADHFRTYTIADVVGVELGGALKNVMAIAVGVSDGMNNGYNARSALITRGLAEIIRLGKTIGADPLTFSGLSGVGDLVLTCTGDLSRNRAVGIKLGQGQRLNSILSEMKMVAEGVKTSLSAHMLAEKKGVEVPVITSVYEMLYRNKTPEEALRKLMDRDLKQEFP